MLDVIFSSSMLSLKIKKKQHTIQKLEGEDSFTALSGS